MPKITEIYAYIMADANEEDEGIPGIQLPDGSTVPLIGADMARAACFIPYIEQMSATKGKPVKLVKFTKMELVATWNAAPKKGNRRVG